MSKEEFARKLADMGMKVENDDGCIMVVSDDRRSFDELVEIAARSGYSGSMGWRKEQQA